MGRLVINNAMTVNGAFEAPVPEPDGWLVLDAHSNQVSLEQAQGADAMVLGRKTYEGLAAVWPQLADDPTLGRVSVLGEPFVVAGRAEDLRRCRAGPPGVDRLDDVWLRRRAAGLPASARLTR